VNLIFWNHILISCFINRIPHFFSLCHNDSRRERELWKKMEKLKEKDGSEIHPGTERQGIGFHFFFMQIWSTENSSKYHGFCVLGGHMKMVIKLRRVYGLISKT
jgi:hypothetical protein